VTAWAGCLVGQRVAATNQLRASLEAFWPGGRHLFADIRSSIARRRWARLGYGWTAMLSGHASHQRRHRRPAPVPDTDPTAVDRPVVSVTTAPSGFEGEDFPVRPCDHNAIEQSTRVDQARHARSAHQPEALVDVVLHAIDRHAV
jgi:hypothetical protein